MNDLNIDDVLYQTVILGAISISIVKIRSKTLISAATAYWFAWTFVIFAATVGIKEGWLASNGTVALDALLLLHYGAFVGFLIGTLLSPKKSNLKYYELLIQDAVFITDKYSSKILTIFFISGAIFLAQKISMVGFNSDYLTNARNIHNENEYSLLSTISSHIAMIANVLLSLIAIKDSKFGVNIRTLVIFIIIGGAMGIANGGRGFLLSYLILYFSNLILCRSAFGKNPSLLSKKEAIQFFLLFVSLLLIFSVMGFLRGGYGDELDIATNILSWPASTIGAMDSWISVAMASTSTYGLNTLGWFADILHRFGLVNYTDERNAMISILDYFLDVHDSSIFIPRSILPDLIFDFGENGIFWGMLLTALLLQVFTLSFVGKGIFLHNVAVMGLTSAFATIQTSIFTPPVVVPLFWSLVLAIYIKYKMKR